MKNKDWQTRIQNINNDISKQADQPPVQQVVPVKKGISTDKKVSQLNVDINTEIVDRLKFHSIKTKKSLKELVAMALIEFLDNADKTAQL